MTDPSKSNDAQKGLGISKILWVEDLEDDVMLGERELKKVGMRFTSRRVETREDFINAVQTFKPDVILSDHSLPQFDSAEAFKIYKALELTIPFILVTGTVSEEFAVSSLKLGIDDYVLKSNLSLLSSAIVNALNQRRIENARTEREKEIKRQNQKLVEDIQQRTQDVINEQNFTDSVINGMPGLFYVMSGNRLIRWNKNLEVVSGYLQEEIGKLTILDLVAGKDKEFASRQIETTMETGSSRFEVVVVTKTGKLIPHYFTGLLAQIGVTKLFVGTGVDISDLKNTQETLRLHDERMELAFSTSGSSWWDWDILSGKIDSHPNRYLTLGYSREEITPHADGWMSLLHPSDRGRVIATIMDCLSGKTLIYDTECRYVSKQGEWKWFHMLGKIVTTDDQGQPLRMIGTADNITKTKLIEQEIVEAKYAAESANRSKSQFLANMSHEIRTPLNAVIGLSHLAMKTELTPKQQDYLKKIHSSSESLLGIINEILDFSKIEAGKLTLEEVTFDLEEVLQKLADVITYKAYAKGLEIAFGIGSDVFTHLIGDPVRLEQILSNLCTNAIKFTDNGEVVVLAKVVEESDHDVKLQFEVRDTGIGMDKKQLSKLFTPFTQADDSISRKYGGTGLGLSIMKRLVELMEGTVWVESKSGEGSAFYFTTRFRKQKLQRKIPVPAIDLRNMGVLVVDDNQSTLKIVKAALESFSFQVITCNSGIEAIHYLKNNNQILPVKLVLMDWKMPGMDGLRTAEIIRQDEQFADIKIIMMSNGYANEDLYLKTDELKLSGIVIKPIGYSMLYDTIMSAIDTGVTQKKKGTETLPADVAHEATHGHLLLVEDNEINQQVASELLEGFGYSLEIVGNGLEAVNKVKESGNPSRFDLILMDLQMPVMGGYSATLEIRKLEEYKTLPIVAMTADAMGGVREKCLEVGMMDFITKPINPNKLSDVLQRWLTPAKKMALPHIVPSPGRKGRNRILIPKLSGIDVKDGLSHVNGNSRLYIDLLIKFMDNHEHFIVDLKKALVEEDTAQGGRMIHTLKGMSANLGMIGLHEASIKVEEEFRSQNVNKTDEILVPLSIEMESVLRSLRDNLVRKSESMELVPLDTVKPLLNELHALLKAQDLEAMSILKKIGKVRGHEKEMKQLEIAIKKYDFDSAVQILEGMGVDHQTI